MNIVIIGQKWIAAEILRRCMADGHKVLAVTQKPDRFSQAAAECGVDVISCWDAIPNCDVIIAAHLHRYLPQSIRDRAAHGTIAYHPSLLPRHRGRDAIRWVIHMREPITGGTVYRMDDGSDTGNILAQDWCHVWPDDTPQTLWRRDLAPMGVRLIMETVQRLDCTGWIEGEPQNEKLATFEPAFSKQLLRG